MLAPACLPVEVRWWREWGYGERSTRSSPNCGIEQLACPGVGSSMSIRA